MSAPERAWKSEGVRRSVERESRIIASCFALAAFAVAIVAGLGAGNDPLSILIRAIIAMVVCHVIGSIAGAILAHAARLHVDSLKPSTPQAQPVERSTDSSPSPGDGGGRNV